MTLQRATRRTTILVGTSVAALVFALTVTGVVLIYGLGVNAQTQLGGSRTSHVGPGTELQENGETTSTLVLHCGQFPCPSRDQMLSMAAAHLDVPYWTLAAAINELGRRSLRVRR